MHGLHCIRVPGLGRLNERHGCPWIKFAVTNSIHGIHSKGCTSPAGFGRQFYKSE
jgi:hypothetical protein